MFLNLGIIGFVVFLFALGLFLAHLGRTTAHPLGWMLLIAAILVEFDQQFIGPQERGSFLYGRVHGRDDRISAIRGGCFPSGGGPYPACAEPPIADPRTCGRPPVPCEPGRIEIMNETLALPPRLVMRDLLLTAFSQKARVFLIFFCIMALSIVIAVQVQPDYKAKSSLLVLLGTEHTFRPVAGQQFTNSGGVDAEQVLAYRSKHPGQR